MNDRYVIKRLINIIAMFFLTLAFTLMIAFLKGHFMDEFIVYLIIDLVFFSLFWFLLEHDRMQKRISGNRETTFRRILTGYLVSWCIIFVSAFLPEFLKPLILIPILMTAFGTPRIAACVGFFLNAMLCLMLGSTIQEMILYSMLVLYGCIVAEVAERVRLKFWYELAVFCISTLFPGLFYYLTYRETPMTLFVLGGICGIVVVLFLHFCYQRIVAERKAEVADMLEDITDESYPLARELLSFSKADYRHARRVSAVAGRCANLVGADAGICAAAGFYYRIGILEGGSIAQSGIRIAQRECFPEAVIRIISEYNGEEELPTTIESAIVQMVDGLIKKLEVLDTDTMSSEWNQDMVIYQTLNEYSAQGLYDKSGLSMNMFLKIREYLVNEKTLV